jgi:hypothetical protein
MFPTTLACDPKDMENYEDSGSWPLKTRILVRVRACGRRDGQRDSLKEARFFHQANLQYRSINCLFIETSLNAVILSQSYLLAPPERSTMVRYHLSNF